MFLPAFGTFLSVVSAFVVSHKPDLRPVLDQEQSKRLGSRHGPSNREDKGRRWWELVKSGGFLTGAKLSQLWR